MHEIGFLRVPEATAEVQRMFGLRPAAALRSTAPAMVRDAVTFGRPIEDVA